MARLDEGTVGMMGRHISSLEPKPPREAPRLRPKRTARERLHSLMLQARARLVPAAFYVMTWQLSKMVKLGPPWFLKMLGRPQWLFELDGSLPHRELKMTPPQLVSGRALELCSRIADAYSLASHETEDLSAIWNEKLARSYAPLHAVLLNGDTAAINEQLRWMFRRPFLSGISTPVDLEDPAAAWSWSLMTYDSLVSLAEAVGALRAENPEQGVVGRAFVEGLDAIPGRIEQHLGISLDYPKVGAPYGVEIGGRLICRETGRHLHSAFRLHEVGQNDLSQDRGGRSISVCEIGAGFGGVAMWFLRLAQSNPCSFTIIDLPLMNAFQAYFLGMEHGLDEIWLFGEAPTRARLKIAPPSHIDALSGKVDIVFNQDSMPEMTESAARGYLDWMNRHHSGLFLSCNQEVGDYGGVDQCVVSELAEDYANLVRTSRYPSWTRRGYVEELFRCGPPREVGSE